MIVCKEVAEYLRYTEEHPNWINKERKLLIENIVLPTMRRNDVFLMKRHTRTASGIVRKTIIHFFHTRNLSMRSLLCIRAIFLYFRNFSL